MHFHIPTAIWPLMEAAILVFLETEHQSESGIVHRKNARNYVCAIIISSYFLKRIISGCNYIYMSESPQTRKFHNVRLKKKKFTKYYFF